jgi:uncharacterized repeat protein (TIGR04138 family)
MDQLKFEAALDQVTSTEPRYDRAAYYFLRDALDHTLNERKKTTGETGHISGQQLSEGIRRYALKQFGPMVPSVFEYWNVHSTEDFGVMVFKLVEVGIFGKTERDSIDDFKGLYNFHDAFVAPYLPESPRMTARRMSKESPVRELN